MDLVVDFVLDLLALFDLFVDLLFDFVLDLLALFDLFVDLLFDFVLDGLLNTSGSSSSSLRAESVPTASAAAALQ